MKLLLATITGAFLGYALAVLAAEAELRREVEQMDAETVELRTRPNVYTPTPRERIAIGQVWHNAWPDYTDPDNAGA